MKKIKDNKIEIKGVFSSDIIEEGIPKPKKCQCGSTQFTYKEEPSQEKDLIIPFFQCNNCGNKHVKCWWFHGPETRKARL